MGLFKGYDVRGVYGKELTLEHAEGLGFAAAHFFQKHSRNKKVFLARDNRNSSPALRERFLKGLLASGFQVIDVGVVSTPLMQYALATEKAAGGVIVTASHNPKEYNGFKFYFKDRPFYSGELKELEKIFLERKPPKKGKGKLSRKSISSDYVEDLLKRVKLQRKLRVVIDSGNGTCGPVARTVFEKLGCKLTSLFEDMDSAFLNHAPDPSKPENLKWLQREVIERNAELGVAFDGDGDRSVFVDGNGKIVRADDVFVLFLRNFAKKGDVVAYDLRLSKVVGEEAKRLGVKAIKTKVGRIALRETLEKNSAVFAGEASSHFFFGDHFGFDDGLYAAAKLAQIISSSTQSLSSLVDSITHYPCTPEMRIHCREEKKKEVVDGVLAAFRKRKLKISTMDGVLVEYGDGWGSLRVSNTEPMLSLRFEASTERGLREIYALFEKELSKEGVFLPSLSSLV